MRPGGRRPGGGTEARRRPGGGTEAQRRPGGGPAVTTGPQCRRASPPGLPLEARRLGEGQGIVGVCGLEKNWGAYIAQVLGKR